MCPSCASTPPVVAARLGEEGAIRWLRPPPSPQECISHKCYGRAAVAGQMMPQHSHQLPPKVFHIGLAVDISGELATIEFVVTAVVFGGHPVCTKR